MADKKPVDKTDISLISKDYQTKINALNKEVNGIKDALYPVNRGKVYIADGSNALGKAMANLGRNFDTLYFTYKMPPESAVLSSISTTYNDDVVAWIEDNTLYISGKGNDIYITSCASFLSSGSTLIKKIVFENFHTEECKSFSSMFGGCSNITELDLSNFRVDSLEDANVMFGGCAQLKTIYANNWNTEKPTGVAGTNMFQQATALKNYNASRIGWSEANYTSGYFTDPALNPNPMTEPKDNSILGRLERVEELLNGVEEFLGEGV